MPARRYNALGAAMTSRARDRRTTMLRCTAWARALLTAALIALASSAQAQPYPAKPITIVVVLAPGTGLDIVVRSYADKLAQSFGKPVVVDNKPGGAQIVAVNAMMAAPADGYTLLVATSGALAINPTLFKQLPYDPIKDLIPVALYLQSPFVLVVDPALPVQSVSELIKYAKERPGKLSYSSSGTAGAPHLAAEMLKQRFGLELVHVPYKNTAQSITDIVAGHVQLAFAEAGASQRLIKDGKLRALAVSSLGRFSTLPDVPPLAEAAAAPDFEAVSWHVLLARAGTPRDILQRLHDEMKRVMRLPDVQERLVNLGLIPVELASIEAMQAYIKSETDKWGALVRKVGLEGTQ